MAANLVCFDNERIILRSQKSELNGLYCSYSKTIRLGGTEDSLEFGAAAGARRPSQNFNHTKKVLMYTQTRRKINTPMQVPDTRSGDLPVSTGPSMARSSNDSKAYALSLPYIHT